MERLRNITHMKCWLFRHAQTKWQVSPSECAEIFRKNQLLEYISECCDYLHLSSYESALTELEEYIAMRERGKS